MKRYFIILIFIVGITCEVINEWIDPHDMNTNEIYKYTTASNPEINKSCEQRDFDESDSLSFLYLKRTVGLLINSAKWEREGNTLRGKIIVNLDEDKYEVLRDFIEKKTVNVDLLKELDATFTKGLATQNQHLWGDFDSKCDRLLQILVDPVIYYNIGGAMVLFCIIYSLIKNNFSLLYITKYLIFLIWVWDAVVKYYTLKDEYDRHNVLAHGKNCPTRKTWADTFNYIFGVNNSCELKLFSPLIVLEEQVRHIVGPMKYIGKGMGKFGSEMFGNLPWGLNLIFFPVMLIFCLLIFIILIIWFANIPIEIKSWFFTFSINKREVDRPYIQYKQNRVKPEQIRAIKSPKSISYVTGKNKKSYLHLKDKHHNRAGGDHA